MMRSMRSPTGFRVQHAVPEGSDRALGCGSKVTERWTDEGKWPEHYPDAASYKDRCHMCIARWLKLRQTQRDSDPLHGKLGVANTTPHGVIRKGIKPATSRSMFSRAKPGREPPEVIAEIRARFRERHPELDV